jgi:hypothetical protein
MTMTFARFFVRSNQGHCREFASYLEAHIYVKDLRMQGIHAWICNS